MLSSDSPVYVVRRPDLDSKVVSKGTRIKRGVSVQPQV